MALAFFLMTSEIVPIVEGAVQYSASRVLPMGVMDLDALLAKELSQKYPDIKFDSHLVIAIRENCCSVPLESSEEMREKVEYTLPDGQVNSFFFLIFPCFQCNKLMFGHFSGHFSGRRTISSSRIVF